MLRLLHSSTLRAVMVVVGAVTAWRLFNGYLMINSYYLVGTDATQKMISPSYLQTQHIEKIANRSLVMLTGEFRGGEKAWDTLFKNVLDPNSADLALLLDPPDPADPPNSLMQRSKYTWWLEQYDDLADAIDLINGTNWRDTHLPHFRDAPDRGLFGALVERSRGSGITVYVIRWFLAQHLMKEGLLEKYDTFVLTRTDHYYRCPVMFTEMDTTNNVVWVPNGEDWGAFCDRFIVMNSKDVLEVLGVLPTILSMPWDPILADFNTEQLLDHVLFLHGINVKKFARSMYIVRRKNDNYHWNLQEYPIPNHPDLFLKYPFEYCITYLNGCGGNFSKYQDVTYTVEKKKTCLKFIEAIAEMMNPD